MADAQEPNRPAANAAEAVRELLARLPVPGKDVVWLADELIGIVLHGESVSLERVRDADTDILVCRSGDVRLSLEKCYALRLFRPLIARFAVLGAEVTGSQPQLYGGRCVLVRSSRAGPVRLDLVFSNTPGVQRLAITRVPLPSA